ncbi:hypothetical protein ACFLTH_09345, partial [Bacteroidota bacterium]
DYIDLNSKTYELLLGNKFSEIYVPSSRYFQNQELQSKSLKMPVKKGLKKIILVRNFFKSGKISLSS